MRIFRLSAVFILGVSMTTAAMGDNTKAVLAGVAAGAAIVGTKNYVLLPAARRSKRGLKGLHRTLSRRVKTQPSTTQTPQPQKLLPQ